MLIEHRRRLSASEIKLYIGNMREARRAIRSLRRTRPHRRFWVTVYDIDRWIMRNLSPDAWPPGLLIDSDRRAIDGSWLT